MKASGIITVSFRATNREKELDSVSSNGLVDLELYGTSCVDRIILIQIDNSVVQ